MRSYFSCNRVWRKCFILGAGVGWDKSDGSACLVIQLGFWVAVIGPHKNPIYRPTQEA